MVRFTLKQLSYFVAAGEAKSITIASERVHISQPSISSAISQLEAEFKVQLFFRHHAQGLSLTPAGERMLIAARELLHQAGGLADLGHEIAGTIGGTLRVGAFRTLSPLILPELWQEFTSAYPNVELEILEADEAELIAKVGKAEIDVAITYEQKGVDLHFEQLALLPTYILLPANHGLAKSGMLSLRDLAAQPFVLLDLPVSRDYFQSLFERCGLTMNVVARTDQPETVRSLVGSGLGYSLLTARPASLTAANGKPLAYVHLDDDHPPMKLGLVTANNIRKPRVVLAFEEYCRKTISTFTIPGMAPF
ncbi:transcriptional regulator, LysR family [Sphingobium chlorophenolicum L-1]|uniref:Transcriptional regulator, LysR family n=1 Tax=Sphingobium chlorophenolicum L-1 TaxID=690566 RepID=F6ETP1_SPHCR|nr:LysR family transcriptional regulator [Sphingobium chlorophenolicum]AEG49536.1 transcriptional regulator, LysR family [Sphingobium chlorophenolicum L-1]